MAHNCVTTMVQTTTSGKRNFGVLRNRINIVLVLAIAALANTSAVAQTKCAKDEKKVCKPTSDGNGTSCYATKNAQNYKVCKGGAGYYICCQTPAQVTANSIHAIDNSYNIYDAAFPEENNTGTNAPTAFPEDNAKEGTLSSGSQEKSVCKKASNGSTSCYKTENAKNYKVCKDDLGYHVCGTIPRP